MVSISRSFKKLSNLFIIFKFYESLSITFNIFFVQLIKNEKQLFGKIAIIGDLIIRNWLLLCLKSKNRASFNYKQKKK